MATLFELNEEWDKWVEARPKEIQELCRLLPPNKLYRLKTSGHRATLYSYEEGGTVTVNVTGQYNSVIFGRRVFGIQPEDLEECDLPGPDEVLGEILTAPKDIDDFIERERKSGKYNKKEEK